MEKRLAITGHSRGIGKCLFDIFSNNNYTVKGYSRSNGYDIGSQSTRDEILNDLKDFDIFINNAFHPYAQTDLLYRIIKQWEGSDKLIINISSKMVFYTGEGFEDYIEAKKSQNDLVKKRIYSNRPKILNVVVGAVDTDMAKVWLSNKINPTDLAKFIYDMTQYQNCLAIQEVIIDVPGLDWSEVKLCQI